MKKILPALALCLALTGTLTYCASRALVYANAHAAAVPKELSSYREVVKRVLPAVVSIEAHPKVRLTQTKLRPDNSSPFWNIPGLPDDLRKEFERFQKQPHSTPDSGRHYAFGSGFIVDPAGVIITNNHVVRDADEVQVMLQDGRKFVGRNIKRDPRTDLAVVHIDAKESLPFLKLGDSDAMEMGDRVLAVGAPLGMTGTVTSGIVSAKGRDIHLNMYEDFLQTDAAINPGNSGGPLVNLAGEVVGVNSVIKSETGGFQGIGLAISSNLTKTVLDQLEHNGTVARGYLGVQTQALNPDVAGRLGVPGKVGVVIAKVLSDTPASKAGLHDGDILTEVAGKKVTEGRNLQKIVAALPIGKSVELVVYRDGARKTLNLTVENQPQSFGLASESQEQSQTQTETPGPLAKLGVQVTDATPKAAKQFGLPDKTEGVIINDVEQTSAAADAGLKSGMVIVKADQQPVKTVADLQKVVDKASLEKGLLLQVRTPQGGTAYVLLKSPAR